MTTPYSCLLFGLGQTGLCAARLLQTRGVRVAGAYSRTSLIGEDLGELIDGKISGVTIGAVNDFVTVPGDVSVALFCTTGRPEDLLGAAKRCLLAGINVITIAEGAFYPWWYAPDIAGELHAAALQGGATLFASGFQDAIMLHLTSVLTAATTSIDTIELHVYSDFSQLGAGSARRMQLGKAMQDFDALGAAPADGRSPMSTSGQVVEALAAHLALGKPTLEYALVPVAARGDLYSRQLELLLPAGSVAGLSETVIGRTAAGVTLTCRLTARLFEAEDQEYFSCSIGGRQPFELRLSPLHSLETTLAIVLNRIPDVLCAPSGYFTAERLQAPRYHHCPS